MDFLREHQLDIMIGLIGICAIIALFTGITKSLSKKRKIILLLMELGATLLLLADREAYIFRGNETTLGFWMVRISNFLVFFMTLFVIYAFNTYIIDLFKTEGKIETIPKRLYIVNIGILIGEVLVIVSQFTGLYYTFDESNYYVRSPGFIICYLIPMLIMMLQLSVVLQYRKRFARGIMLSLSAFTIIPMIASILQIFAYGLSLTNISVVGMVIVVYVFALLETDAKLERAHKIEVDYLKEEQKTTETLFVQTAQALTSAIDAKDKYTRGHSARVAEYSRMLAELAGKTEKECTRVYYAGLTHDVGKIGISDSVINKKGKLTDEEYEEIKQHPVIGKRILSSISISPYLQTGASYHHERYDGKGYPDGLKGEDIPEIARIIAVADAYDAMTSKRSYRFPMPQSEVRQEIENGIGKQFDPLYAELMLRLIDQDTEYKMKEEVE